MFFFDFEQDEAKFIIKISSLQFNACISYLKFRPFHGIATLFNNEVV